MYSAADLVQALQRRLRLNTRRWNRPGEFPPGWQAWFEAMAQRPGKLCGVPPEALISVFLARPVAPPGPALAAMTRWQAFASIWRPHWHAPEPAERGLRTAAAASTLVVHLMLAAFLLWLLYGQPPVQPAQRKGEDVVQIEFIGTGSPEEVGGGEQPAEAAPAQDPAPSTGATRTAASPQAEPDAVPDPPSGPATASTPPESVEPAPTPAPALPAPAPEQPLAVTEPVAPPDTEVFLLPPPSPRLADPLVAVPELNMPIPEIADREVPMPLQAPPLQALSSRRQIIQSPLPLPALERSAPTVAEREVPTPLRRAIIRPIAAPAMAAPDLPTALPQVRERQVPSPVSPPADAIAASPVATNPAPAEPGAAPTNASPRAAEPAPGGAVASTALRSAGSGPPPATAPGSWPSPARADHWGDAGREVAGGQRGQPSGLYDSDGSVRLGEAPSSASPASPPGTITEEIADLDRSGTWLKRRPNDYEPGTFDKYWRPSETLLAEWVRRGIKEVAIPIPGTGKRIVCVVSVLGLGGGCGISDPNLNDQPATARPPPDIPFKPELQEDNGSIRPGT